MELFIAEDNVAKEDDEAAHGQDGGGAMARELKETFKAPVESEPTSKMEAPLAAHGQAGGETDPIERGQTASKMEAPLDSAHSKAAVEEEARTPVKAPHASDSNVPPKAFFTPGFPLDRNGMREWAQQLGISRRELERSLGVQRAK